MIEVYTIGVYNSNESEFFAKLKDNGIELFCDIRQRRGVRGSQYKFVNSNYLQNKLKDLSIDYLYIKELAPTSEIRQKQKEADLLLGESKKMRTKLGSVFATEYNRQILTNYDMASLIKSIAEKGYKKIVFFCVEERAEACHRSLVAKAIQDITSCNIVNL